MDIEGSEFKVFPRMLQSGLLCKNMITEMSIEVHMWARKSLKTWSSLKVMKAQMKAQACEATTLVSLDDESFLMDGMPMPACPKFVRSHALPTLAYAHDPSLQFPLPSAKSSLSWSSLSPRGSSWAFAFAFLSGVACTAAVLLVLRPRLLALATQGRRRF